ncbi:hypothetical protein AAHA92_19553 [Salvia divinorum]|uniref:Response regulatory domain-containing protein n=1 Tax=Salvia divinorum TaxID=28513 RepID=A0ABD1H924_SALDI
MTSYLSIFVHQLHVVFVDHELDSLNTASLIGAGQHRVSHYPFADAAIPMLTNGETKIDLIIANINSPHVMRLLELGVSMEIPTILMSNDDDAVVAMWAIQKGAFLYIKRPTSLEMLKYLWQHVAREAMRVLRERERLMVASFITPPCGEMENPSNLFAMDEGKRKRNDYYNENYVENEHSFGNSTMSQGNVKRKMCTEWTAELHKKFEDAIYQLGDGNIFPKEIVKKMNMPELGRMQVASHLQKIRQAGGEDQEPSDGERSGRKRRRFGAMPGIMLAKLKDRAHDHSSNSEMEARVTESGMANQSTDGEGPSHKPSWFGSMLEIMKANSKDRVDDHGSRSEMEAVATETGMANQLTYNHVETEALVFFPTPESVAVDTHSSDDIPTFDEINAFLTSL